jgi:hypothetical protein
MGKPICEIKEIGQGGGASQSPTMESKSFGAAY